LTCLTFFPPADVAQIPTAGRRVINYTAIIEEINTLPGNSTTVGIKLVVLGKLPQAVIQTSPKFKRAVAKKQNKSRFRYRKGIFVGITTSVAGNFLTS
jgi:hypothetical protein